MSLSCSKLSGRTEDVMGMFDNAVPGGDLAKPVMVALGALLLGKMVGGFGTSSPSPQASGPSQAGSGAAGTRGGGLVGGLGGFVRPLAPAGAGAGGETPGSSRPKP